MTIKRLILRLSSLGDIILASSALEVHLRNLDSSKPSQVDWVVASEFSGLLQGHPKINQLFEFKRTMGFRAWVQFSRKIWDLQYEEVYDLHLSLRTRWMRLLFVYWGLIERKPLPKWKSISKQKTKLYLYFIFKNLWPRSLYPTPWVIRFTQCLGGTGEERPNLRHLLKANQFPEDFKRAIHDRPYLCVMPSSRWGGKVWPVEKYVELLKKLPFLPVVLGSTHDLASQRLVELLRESGFDHFSGVGIWSLGTVACVLSQSEGYLGGDTGLAHLAESVGVSAKMIFGPTTPQMGFGPWSGSSRSSQLSLWCRPCSKDGESCYRFTQKHLCIKKLPVETALKMFDIP